MIYNELTVYPVYLHNTDRVNMVTFNVIGNHDHDQTTLLKDSLGTMHYEMHLGAYVLLGQYRSRALHFYRRHTLRP